jgi:hypothetical protein
MHEDRGRPYDDIAFRLLASEAGREEDVLAPLPGIVTRRADIDERDFRTSQESIPLPKNATLSDAAGTSRTIGPRLRSKKVKT